MSSQKIILASQSPQRALVLKTLLSDKFIALPAHLDEKKITGSTPEKRIANIALAKAEVVRKQHPQAIIIAADTVVSFDLEILEKPDNLREADSMLHKLSGHKVQVLTGFAYLDESKKIHHNSLEKCWCQFRNFSSSEISYYVTHNPVLTWSAAFCPAYTPGDMLIDTISGSYNSFCYGLPTEILIPLLKKSGIKLATED